MSGGENICKYMATEAKRYGSASDRFTVSDYFQKYAGLFDGNGMIGDKELKAMKERARNNRGNIWHGFISFNEENSYKIARLESCFRLIKQTFGEFLKEAGMDKENIDLICALYKDRPHHLHIHFCFWEKEPKEKNKRAAGYKYRAKGKIAMSVIDRMVERLNAYELDDDLKKLRQDVFTSDWHRKIYRMLVKREYAHDLMQSLIDEIPRGNVGYASKEMKPYRAKIDLLAEEIIKGDWELSERNKRFRKAMDEKEEDLKEIMGNYYKVRQREDELYKNYFADGADVAGIKSIKTVEWLRWDYKRRLGNVILREVRYLQGKQYKRKPQKKYKSNDRALKRKIAISGRIVSKGIDSFLKSAAEMFMPEVKNYRNRLKEIEEEMREEQECAQSSHREEKERVSNRWNYEKG